MAIKLETKNNGTPEIFVFSKNIGLCGAVLNILEKEECEIIKIISDLNTETRKIINENFLNNSENPKYVLIAVEDSSFSEYSEVEALIHYIFQQRKANIKVLLSFPFNQSEKLHKFYKNIINVMQVNDSKARVYFFGDILSTKLNNQVSLLDKIIISYKSKNSYEVFEDSVLLYPVSEKTVGEHLVKALFSISVSETKTRAALGRPISIGNFFEKIGLRYAKKAKIGKHVKIWNPQVDIDPTFIPLYPELIFQAKSSIFDSDLNNMQRLLLKLNKIKTPYTIKTKIVKILTVIIGLIILPIVMFLLANLSAHNFIANITTGNIRQATDLTNLSKILLKPALVSMSALVKVPGLYGVYNNFYERSFLLEQQLNIQRELIKTLNNTIEYSYSLVSEDINSRAFLDDIYLSLNSVFIKSKFLEGETNTKSTPLNINLKKVLLLTQLLDKRNLIFGYEKPVQYAIAVGDNSQTFSSGGKVISIITFVVNKGKIEAVKYHNTGDIDGSVQDSYKSDSLLKKYFEIQNESVADSYIFPDFRLSAQRIEWFLDKSLDMQVDGVIGIDKNDFNELTNLFLLNNNKSVSKMILKIDKLLNEKQIQIYSKDPSIENLLIDLNWGGGVDSDNCGNYCYSDLLGISELSLSPVGTSLKREVNITVSFQKNIIKRKLTYYLDNIGDVSYDTYLRLLANTDAGFSESIVVSGGQKETKRPEVVSSGNHKEAGIFLSVKPKTVLAISFFWESGVPKLDKIESYSISIKKQSNIDKYPLEFVIESLENEVKSKDSAFVLTNRGELVYKANLEKDASLRLLFGSN